MFEESNIFLKLELIAMGNWKTHRKLPFILRLFAESPCIRKKKWRKPCVTRLFNSIHTSVIPYCFTIYGLVLNERWNAVGYIFSKMIPPSVLPTKKSRFTLDTLDQEHSQRRE